MQLRILAFTFAVLLSAPFAFAGTLAPGGGPTTGVLDTNSNVGTTLAMTFFGHITGTGAIAQTQAIYGNATNDTTGGVLLCTITLSGTNQAQDAAGSSTAPYPYYYVTTTGTSGTGTSGTVYILY